MSPTLFQTENPQPKKTKISTVTNSAFASCVSSYYILTTEQGESTLFITSLRSRHIKGRARGIKKSGKKMWNWGARRGGLKEYGIGTLRWLIRRVCSSQGSYFGETQSSQNIPMARPNQHDMPLKNKKKVRLGICRTQIQPKI